MEASGDTLSPGPALNQSHLPLSCEVVSDLAEAERLGLAWATLAERCTRPELTQTPDWLLTWWRVYGGLQGRQLRLGLFYDGGRLVGLAPLLRRRYWFGRTLPFRRLEFLGSGEPPDDGIYSSHLGVLAEPGAEEVIAARLVRALTDGDFGAWDEVVLSMLPGDTPWPGSLAGASQKAGLNVELTEATRGPYAALPATWETYLASLTRHGRHSINRALRAFDAWSGGTTRLECVASPADLDKGKEILVRLHHCRWAKGTGGVFRSPLYLQFHDAMLQHLAQRGWLELLWLCAHGEPVAVMYGLKWAGKVCLYQMGRRTDVPEQLRPGIVLVALAIRRAIEAGQREFDLLPDDAMYKRQLAPNARPFMRLRIARGGLLESLRRAAMSCRAGIRHLTGLTKHQGAMAQSVLLAEPAQQPAQAL
jgi:CelD/BcsL family acetyltransferase involved in cellulose biosynthesis